MMRLNDWKITIKAIRNLSKGRGQQTTINNFNRLMKFLKEKEPRIKQLDTKY